MAEAMNSLSFEEMEMALKRKKLEMRIRKANNAKEDLDLKILEAQLQIKRMSDHKVLQDEEIEKAQVELDEL